MEDQTQSGPQPVQEPLKIRSMQDDLKKAAGQARNPAPQTASAPRAIPEPPSYLPGVVISPATARPVAAFTPPIRPTAPPTIATQIAPLPAAKPVFEESIKRPVPPILTPQPAIPILAPDNTEASHGSGLFKKLAIAGVIVLVIAGATYFLWPKETPEPIPLVPPVSLMPAESTAVLVLKNELELTDKLAEALTISQTQNTLKYLPIKVGEPKEEFLPLEQFLSILTIGLPSAIAGQTDGKYSLFSYSQFQSTSSPKTENRFVLVLSLTAPANSQDLKNWEPKMLQDLELFYSSLPDDLPIQINFSDSERKDVSPHRFVNFGSPDLSLDYAVAGNKLIFATSKQSMNKALDLIVKTNE